MKPMMRIAMPALAALVLVACGGGGTMPTMPVVPVAVPAPVADPEPEPMAAKPEAPAEPEPSPVADPEPVAAGEPDPDPEPAAAVPVADPAPEPEPAPVVVADPAPSPVAPVVEPLPDPATLLQSHEALSLPDGFNAVLADEAMYLLANIPYLAPAGGGAGLAAASLALQAGALALYQAERTAEYAPDHAVIDGPWIEEVDRVNPEVETRVRKGSYLFYESHAYSQCIPSRGECHVIHPHPALRGSPFDYNHSGGLLARAPIADMPFVGDAMREQSEGVRSRGGIDLRYWTASGEVPWMRYRHKLAADEYAAETWSGYGAWQDWSGFGLVMLAHNHQWDLYDSAWHHFIAGGDLTGGQPEVTGTMRGAAVAHTSSFTDGLNIIADGTVEMTVRLGATPSFDITIGDWRGYNLTERGEIGLPATVSIRDLDMRNIPIQADGTFGGYEIHNWDEDGNPRENSYGTGSYLSESVRGAFYGPGGSEAAGTFNTWWQSYLQGANGHREVTGNELVNGAFGVRKPKK